MPTDIPGTNTFPTNVRAPAGGDARTAASVANGLSDLADRTTYIKTLVDAGVVKIQTFATVAAMKVPTTMATNDLAFVPGLGLFRFNGASSVTGDDRFIVTPTSVGGRWERIEHGLRQASSLAAMKALTGMAANDLAVLTDYGIYWFQTGGTGINDGVLQIKADDNSGFWTLMGAGLFQYDGGFDTDSIRLDPTKAPVPNRIVSITEQYEATPTGISNVSQVTPGSAFGPSITLSLLEGDVVVVTGTVGWVEDFTGTMDIIIREGSARAGNGIVRISGTTGCAISTRYVAAADGSFTFQPSMFGGLATEDPTIGATHIVATLIRP